MKIEFLTDSNNTKGGSIPSISQSHGQNKYFVLPMTLKYGANMITTVFIWVGKVSRSRKRTCVNEFMVTIGSKLNLWVLPVT